MKVEGKGLGRRINMVRKDRGFTADRLSEPRDINATYLRQIEGGTKVSSLPVFINIRNALKVSPDYLPQDALEDNEANKIQELARLWESTSPSQQDIAIAMIRAGFSIIALISFLVIAFSPASTPSHGQPAGTCRYG